MTGSLTFAMDGSRRYNQFSSPWQFATQCWANAYFESEDTLCLEMLFPENNSSRKLRFVFAGSNVVIKEKVFGPGKSGEMAIPFRKL